MARIRINRDIGPLAMAIFFILFGLIYLFNLHFEGMNIVIGLCALIAGVLGLLDLS